MGDGVANAPHCIDRRRRRTHPPSAGISRPNRSQRRALSTSFAADEATASLSKTPASRGPVRDAQEVVDPIQNQGGGCNVLPRGAHAHLLEQGGMTPHRSLPPRSRDTNIIVVFVSSSSPPPGRSAPTSSPLSTRLRMRMRRKTRGLEVHPRGRHGLERAPPPEGPRPDRYRTFGTNNPPPDISTRAFFVIFSLAILVDLRPKIPRRRSPLARSRRTCRPPVDPTRNEIPSTRPPPDALAEISRPDPPSTTYPSERRPPRPGGGASRKASTNRSRNRTSCGNAMMAFFDHYPSGRGAAK